MFRWKFNSDPQATLHELVGDYELPSFPAAALETLRMLREGADVALIAERLLADPGLSVRILRTVNSAAFGLRQPASDLGYAVGLLGTARVESVVLAAAVRDTLPRDDRFDLAGFWATSARKACLARRLAGKVPGANAAEAFTAGLLQDMAIPVLVQAKGSDYLRVLERSFDDPAAPLQQLEGDAFGFDHAGLGAVMADLWELPSTLTSAIAVHHATTTGETDLPPATAVGLVRHAAGPEAALPLREHCESNLAMSTEDVDDLFESAGAEAHSLAESMVDPAAVA